eukprot:TRINITY_DN15926_c0_g2_i1.p1 TRINITY_DN15926_c0_g2~~TRINITY_DN15926_c0_g2_i1.p1  ORF type:complete len:315 (+),score=104.22 TRINITY_DN15926_c0_g2_i1:156-1100(+)
MLDSLDATTLLSLVVSVAFAWVILGDVRRWAAKAFFAPPAETPAAQQPRQPATTPAATTSSTAPTEAAPTAAQTRKPAETEAKAETPAPEPTPAPPAPAAEAPKPADDLDDLLDNALDTIDSEDNLIDQAWDKVHDGMQLSTHVSGLNEFIQNSARALEESMKKADAMKGEQRIEKTREERAAQLKRQGNAAYEREQYARAITIYSQAIRLLPDTDTEKYSLYSNRSAANLYSNNPGAALKDAEHCIRLNPKFAKGVMRKGMALEALKEWGDAKSVYQGLIDSMPKDPKAADAAEGIQRCTAAMDDQLDALLDD